jgi:hypothetical protein
LFVGAVVLALSYELFMLWLNEAPQEQARLSSAGDSAESVS